MGTKLTLSGMMLLVLASVPNPPLVAQAEVNAAVPKPGAAKAEVASSLGEPFQKGRFTEDDDEVRLEGVPTGFWSIFHLSTHNRLYVTFLHFSSDKVDGIMLMLNGHWNIHQILSDQPQLAATCAAGCDVFRLTSPKKEVSLLLRPVAGSAQSFDIYFPGATAEIVDKWRRITSMESEPEWVFVIRRAQFDQRHSDWKREAISHWMSGQQ